MVLPRLLPCCGTSTISIGIDESIGFGGRLWVGFNVEQSFGLVVVVGLDDAGCGTASLTLALTRKLSLLSIADGGMQRPIDNEITFAKQKMI